MKVRIGVFILPSKGIFVIGTSKTILCERQFSPSKFIDELEKCLSVWGISKENIESIYFSPPLPLYSNKTKIDSILHFRILPKDFNTPTAVIPTLNLSSGLVNNQLREVNEKIRKANVISIISPFGIIRDNEENKVKNILKQLTQAKIINSATYPHIGFYKREEALLIAALFYHFVRPYVEKIKNFLAPRNLPIYWTEDKAFLIGNDFLPTYCGENYEIASLIQIARGSAIYYDFPYAFVLFRKGHAFKLFEVINYKHVKELSSFSSTVNSKTFNELIRKKKNIEFEFLPIINFTNLYFSNSQPYYFIQAYYSKNFRYLGLISSPATLASIVISEEKTFSEVRNKLINELTALNKKFHFFEEYSVETQETAIRYLTSRYVQLKVFLRET
ncbi:hypothetical protein [Caldanaerobacter subterraneus]|uniref:Uncharacterized protein n=1 Tax=Caldanaerobacter subterraneus TaxID=911092 RepID=A0A7Y2L6A8_9THEO|nr:hypothetical protein [Caldanaerobacter subterraneus]NNG66090.1 hypothetical protein [Caldanaerobacter subterraneus]